MTEPEKKLLSFSSTAYAIAALAIVVRCLVAWHSRFTSEDFLITLRYAENLAHGQGLVFNPGERVLGTTTPLYTLFLAAIISGELDSKNAMRRHLLTLDLARA